MQLKFTKIKITICLILISLLLLSCSKQSDKYVLLYTSDYAYGEDSSYLVSIDDSGKIQDMETVNGALYYNIIEHNDDFILNNGSKSVVINDNFESRESDFDCFKGYLEKGSYFIYNDSIVNIYNTGFDDEKYISLIEIDSSIVEVEGYVNNYVVHNENLFLLMSYYEDENDYSYKMVVIDLNKDKIISEIVLEELLGLQNIFGLKYDINNGNMIIFIESMYEVAIGDNQNKIISISLEDFSINDYNANTDISQGFNIIRNTFFKLEDDIYCFSREKELIKMGFNNEKVEFINTDIFLPNDFGTFPIINTDNNELHILENGSDKLVVKIDITNKIVHEPILIADNKYTRNLDVFSFIVIDYDSINE